MAAPNAVAVAWSIVRSLRTVDPPRPDGVSRFDHDLLGEALAELAARQISGLATAAASLGVYLEKAGSIDPDTLTSKEAKAFWINIYNAGALRLAAAAQAAGHDSVLRVPGGFQLPVVKVGAVELSLDDIEHAKVRRFGDPRVHAALVCGSVSCPTLRGEPYSGEDVDRQLDQQMRSFLAGGGAVPDAAVGVIHLSRVFMWFGSDFVRPARMPTFVPSRSGRVLEALRPWLDEGSTALVDAGAAVRFQSYDWGLACAVV